MRLQKIGKNENIRPQVMEGEIDVTILEGTLVICIKSLKSEYIYIHLNSKIPLLEMYLKKRRMDDTMFYRKETRQCCIIEILHTT